MAERERRKTRRKKQPLNPPIIPPTHIGIEEGGVGNGNQDSSNLKENEKIYNALILSIEKFKHGKTTQRIIATCAILGIVGTSIIAYIQDKRFREFTKIDERAYICYEGIDGFRFDSTVLGQVDVNFINAGKTPAYHVFSCSRFTLGEVKDSDWNKISPLSDEDGATVGAGQSYIRKVSTDTAIVRKDILAFIKSADNKSPKWSIYGKVWYFDKFKDSHWTRYCRVIRYADTTFPTFKRYNDTEEDMRGKD